MHTWMEEKDTEIQSLKDQLQQQQAVMLQKQVELAVLQEQLMFQEL
jgi:hypothetical protein